MAGKPVIRAAFLEEKTAKEWSEDRRCVVSYDCLMGRITRGWPMEAAVVVPIELSTKSYVAFGQKRTLIQWLTDDRCNAPATILLERIEAEWEFQAALTREVPYYRAEPVPEKRWQKANKEDPRTKYEAFGEKKLLCEWARDRRSHVSSYNALKGRILRGIPLEAAILFSERQVRSTYWCFGEYHRLIEWLLDKRCMATPLAVYERMEQGEPLEQAISRPAETPKPKPKSKKLTPAEQLARDFGVLNLVIDGVKKTIHQWTQDADCEVSAPVLSTRVRQGWKQNRDILKRITKETPFSRQFKAVTAEGESLGEFPTVKLAREALIQGKHKGKVVHKHSGEEWPLVAKRKPKPERKKPKIRIVTAWEETKTLGEWMKDERCVISDRQVAYKRLDAGWTPEDALSKPEKKVYMARLKKLNAALHFGHNEWKSYDDWAKDKRCEVEPTTFRSRVRKGMPVEAALKRRRGLPRRDDSPRQEEVPRRQLVDSWSLLEQTSGHRRREG